MLEPHAPHETIHTWKDFFIHIATIVIGLLIAVGLEQAVELIHKHERANHAREMLAQEVDFNRVTVRRALYSIAMHENYLFADLPVIARARNHSLLPTDRIVVWVPGLIFAQSAWLSLHESDTASLLPYAELQRFARIYRLQDEYNEYGIESRRAIVSANTVFYQSAADRFVYASSANRANASTSVYGERGDAAARADFENQAPGPDKIGRLTPTQLDRLEEAIQQGIYADDSLTSQCVSLQAQYEAIAHQ